MLDRRGANELDERFAHRLDRLSNALARIERDGHVQIESLALFIRYMLTVNAPLAEERRGGARVRPRPVRRLRRAQVGQQLASGRRSLGAENGQ